MLPTDDRLCDLSGAVVLVGSMLSSDQHSGLPSGQAVSREIVRRLLQPIASDLSIKLPPFCKNSSMFEDLALMSPFEVILQHHPNPADVRRKLSNVYISGKPNMLHGALAYAIHTGSIRNVITTNYDTCIEAAVQSVTDADVIIEESDIEECPHSAKSDRVSIFKIHGCATRDHTMVCRLSEEGSLPPWKRRILEKLVADRDLVVMGYSGLDFDICPVLFNLRFRRLIWLFSASDDLEAAIGRSSPNVRNATRAGVQGDRIFGRLGGFDRIFEGLPGLTGYNFVPTRVSANIAADLFEGETADPFSYAVWRAMFFHAIANRTGCEAILMKMSHSERMRPEALRLWSETLERAGRYKSSVQILRQLERHLRGQGKADDILELMFVATGRHHTAFRLLPFYLSWIRYKRFVRRCDREKLTFDRRLAEARDAYLLILAIKQLAVIPAVGKKIAMWRVRGQASGVFERAAQLHYERGEWQEVRLLRVACRDLGLDISVKDSSRDSHSGDFLLESHDAFTHANNIGGQCSSYRRLRRRDPTRCGELIDAVAACGLAAEYWKSYTAFLGDISAKFRRERRYFALRQLFSCEYGFPAKILFSFYMVFKMVVHSTKSRN